MSFLPPSIRAEMLAAADAEGSSVIVARMTYVRSVMTSKRIPAKAIRPGVEPAYLRCDPPPCVVLRVVADHEIPSDWEVAH